VARKQWLDGYESYSETHGTGLLSVDIAPLAPAGTATFSSVAPRRSVLVEVGLMVAGALIATIVGVAGRELATSAREWLGDLAEPMILASVREELAAIKVERFTSRNGAIKAIGHRSPQALLQLHFTLSSGHVRIGRAPDAHTPVYGLLPRSTMKERAEELLADQAHPLKVYEVFPPLHWTDVQFQHALSHWADGCQAPSQMIPVWSSFTEGHVFPRINQCRIGGRCLIVSRDCRNAFQHMNG
jgi:hypothetical protein